MKCYLILWIKDPNCQQTVMIGKIPSSQIEGFDLTYKKISKVLLTTTPMMTIRYGTSRKIKAAFPNPAKPALLYKALEQMAKHTSVPISTISARSSLGNPPVRNAHLASKPASPI